MSKQIIFRVELQYGDVKWVIRRTLYDFYKLHLNLVAKNYENVPKFPGQLSYAFSLAKASLGMKADDRVGYLRETNLTRRQSLQQYLIKVLEDLNWTVSYDLYEFLEISAMSLTKDMGWKGKEAYVDMKSIDTSMSICGIGGVSRWDKSWAFLRDSYIAFCPNVGSNVPTEVFLFDQDFFVRHKEQTLGLNHRHIELGNKHKTIEIKGDHSRDMLEWMEYFNKMKQSSPWVISHRFGSFAPEREDAKVRYYVDGKDYFHAVSDALMAAKSEIYICDWWLSPELYLRRPPEKNEEFRLDRLLKKKAMEGVMIYIVVYKEISLALTLDSAHTKIWLQGLHKNIQVQRHPDHLGVNATQFWAHHEKICVIDCRIAFIGGLDLCYGRYDSRTHQLSDYHPSGQGTIWPGLDYSNPRIKDFVNVKEYNNELIEKKLLPRMPWHDVHIGMAGQPARDVARHFVQRWNFVKRSKAMKKSHMKFLTPKGEFVSTRNETGWTGSQKVQILRSSSLWSQGVDLERSIQDAYLHTIENAEHFIYIENQFFVTLAVENGHPDLKNHIGIALVNRILRAHREQKKFRVIVVMPLMPAFEADIMSSEAGTLRKVMHFQYVSICRGGNSVIERLVANGVDPDLYIGFYGLRSFDRIKHGKFDAIVEAVKEEERRQKQQKGEASQGKDAGDKQEVEDADDKDEDELNRQRSLVSKLLLDPIPKDAEAERIKEISDRRKDLDALRTWDESITKNSMARSVREHGYVPAATEQSLADSNANAQIQHEVYQAEIEDGRHAERDDNQPQILDGLGTMVRTAIEKMKGSKDQGNLEPRHHKLTRGSLPPRRRSRRRGFGYGESDGEYDSDSDSDSLQTERRQQQKRGTTDQESGPARRATEGIIEPVPQPPHVASFSSEDGYGKNLGPSPSTQGDPTEGGDASPSEFPNADEPGPVAADGRVEDNEVDDFVTEQLYIHSKLMIVDDRIIICGSANINDRSQVGFRDSEIAIIIEDTDMVDSTMNGVPYKVGKVAHTMRTDLFKEHLGLLPHVEHDVVTKASVLPVDLDAPHKDPEQARLELIRQQRAKQEQGHQQQKQKSAFVAEQAWEHDVIQQESSSSSTLAPAVGRVATGPEVHVTPPQEGGSDDPPAQVRPRKQGQRVRVASSDGDTAGGYVEEYYPDEEEGAAVDQWHSPLAAHFHDAKRASIDDPGYADRIVMDPLHDDFYELWWRRVATTNTEIFRDVFRCVPDDTVETWDDYRNFMPNPKKVLTGHVALAGATSEDVQKRLQGVTGHLVEFPLKFLSKENLLGGVVEGAVVPMEIFT
ncbi:hypothetical protein BGW38_001891 [Lunasporangiospora selenospora]|uniref:Phospholipase n=1 Tax=Lunasporangiospora selenospora TaxID=979761 RepID=A0A9P6FTH3_9FUNG|nr:hypothetical protein BGW38_001891 [Lunasporangiospora selenospora]